MVIPRLLELILFGSKGLALNSLANPEVINSRSVTARSTGSPLRPRRISSASDMLSRYLVSCGDMPDGGLGMPGNFVGVRFMSHGSPP